VCVCVRERVCVCVCERERVCVCVRERERESVCVREREREREKEFNFYQNASTFSFERYKTFFLRQRRSVVMSVAFIIVMLSVVLPNVIMLSVVAPNRLECSTLAIFFRF
jgi:hypothetical protein